MQIKETIARLKSGVLAADFAKGIDARLPQPPQLDALFCRGKDDPNAPLSSASVRGKATAFAQGMLLLTLPTEWLFGSSHPGSGWVQRTLARDIHCIAKCGSFVAQLPAVVLNGTCAAITSLRAGMDFEFSQRTAESSPLLRAQQYAALLGYGLLAAPLCALLCVVNGAGRWGVCAGRALLVAAAATFGASIGALARIKTPPAPDVEMTRGALGVVAAGALPFAVVECLRYFSPGEDYHDQLRYKVAPASSLLTASIAALGFSQVQMWRRLAALEALSAQTPLQSARSNGLADPEPTSPQPPEQYLGDSAEQLRMSQVEKDMQQALQNLRQMDPQEVRRELPRVDTLMQKVKAQLPPDLLATINLASGYNALIELNYILREQREHFRRESDSLTQSQGLIVSYFDERLQGLILAIRMQELTRPGEISNALAQILSDFPGPDGVDDDVNSNAAGGQLDIY